MLGRHQPDLGLGVPDQQHAAGAHRHLHHLGALAEQVWIAALVLAAVSLRQAIRVDAARAFRRPSSKLKRPLMRLQPSEPLKGAGGAIERSSGCGLGLPPQRTAQRPSSRSAGASPSMRVKGLQADSSGGEGQNGEAKGRFSSASFRGVGGWGCDYRMVRLCLPHPSPLAIRRDAAKWRPFPSSVAMIVRPHLHWFRLLFVWRGWCCPTSSAAGAGAGVSVLSVLGRHWWMSAHAIGLSIPAPSR